MACCPHRRAPAECPLYVAAHDPATAGEGCDDGDLAGGRCAADRHGDYAARVTRLAISAAGRDIILQCALKRAAREAREQRARNALAARLA